MMKKTTLITLVAILAAVTSVHAQWKFGIGAGAGAFDIDGDLDIGILSSALEYDSGDLESGFTLQGYASTGNWVFRSSVSSLEVEANQTRDNGGALSNLNFKTLAWDLTAGYIWLDNGTWTVSTYAGLRGITHKLETETLNLEFDNSWTDAVIGTSVTYELMQNWFWSSALEGGVGGSEGSFGANTGVTWRFGMHWSASAVLSWSAAEFEEGEEGESDYYFYDANMTKLGLGVMYHF